MRRVFALLNLVLTTLFLSIIALLVSLFDRSGESLHRIARFWAGIHLKICGIKVDLSGTGNVTQPPYIFMGNHQSALDIFSLLASLPLSCRWIAKRELFLIPFFGWALKRAGYISLDRRNPRDAVKAVEEAARNIRKGTNIIIFPEGTRSKDGKLLPFKKGSFSLVLRAKVPVVPVGICNTNKLQPVGSFVPVAKGTVYIKIGKPIFTADEGRRAKEKIIDKVRTEIEQLMACGGTR